MGNSFTYFGYPNFSTSPTSVWNPGSFQGQGILSAWLRADIGVTLGSTMTWVDSIGGNSFQQSTSAQQPTLNTSDSAYNGHSSLSFLSSNTQSLTLTSLTLPIPYTMIWIGNETTGSTAGFMGSNNAALTCLYSSGVDAAMYCAGAVIAARTTVTPSIVAGIFTSTVGSIYVNSSATPANTGTIAGASLSSQFYIGAVAAGAGAGTLNGKIAEVMIFSQALAQPTLSQVFQYAGARYGQGWS